MKLPVVSTKGSLTKESSIDLNKLEKVFFLITVNTRFSDHGPLFEKTFQNRVDPGPTRLINPFSALLLLSIQER
jgi:hypothetical protein